MIRVLKTLEETLYIGNVTNKVVPLLFKLIHKCLVLIDITRFVKTKLSNVFDAHFIDWTQFCHLQRRHGGDVA